MGGQSWHGREFSRRIVNPAFSLAGAASVVAEAARSTRIWLDGFDAQVTCAATAQTLTLDWFNGLAATVIDTYPLAISATTRVTREQVAVPTAGWPPKGVDSGTEDAAVTYAATTLTDTRKNWEVNRWRGHLVTADGKLGVVSSNTATVLTVPSWNGGTPAANSAYEIAPPYREAKDGGVATGSTATTLTDTTKAWTVNAYAGRMVYAKLHGQLLSRGFILSNTATALTIVAWEGGTPAATASYVIDDPTWSLRATVTNTTNAPTAAQITAWCRRGALALGGGLHTAL